MPTGIVHLEFHVSGKIGERSVHAISSQDEVDHVIRVVEVKRKLVVRHGKFFVSHPAGDLGDLVNVSANVA